MKQISNLFRDALQKGFFHLLSANFIIGFLGFGSQLLVAKFLSPIELGRIKTMQSFINVAVIVAGFGFSTSILKMCSEKIANNEKYAILKGSFKWTFVPTLSVLGILYLLSRLRILSPDPFINKWFFLYMFIIPAMVYTTLIMVYLQALKKIQLMAKLQVIIRLVSFVFLIGVTYKFGFIGFIFSSVIIGYISFLPLYNIIKKDLKVKLDYRRFFSRSFYYAFWGFIGNTFSTFGQFVDIFMLNFLVTDRSGIGYYSLATILILGLNYITITVQSIATPYFSEKSNDINEFLRALIKYEKIMIITAFIVSIFSFFTIPALIKIFYGVKYTSTGFYFQILILKYFFWSCYALLGAAMVGLGAMKYNFMSLSISVPLSTLINYFMIKNYGLMGAARAQSLSYFLTLIIVIMVFRKVLNKARVGEIM